MLNMLELRSKVSAVVWDKLMSYDSVWLNTETFREWLCGAMAWHDTDEGNDFWKDVHDSDEPHTILNEKFNPRLEHGSTWVDFEKLLAIPAIEELRGRGAANAIPHTREAYDWLESSFTWARQPEGGHPYEFWSQIKRDLERYDYQVAADRINSRLVYASVLSTPQPSRSMSWTDFEQLLSPSAVQHIKRYCYDYPISSSIRVDGEAHMWLMHSAFRWADTPHGEEWWREVYGLLEDKKWQTAAMKINDKFNKPKTNKVMEKIYQLTGDSARGVVQQYHSKPAPLKHSSGAGTSDIKCFGRKKKRLTLEEWSGSYESRYTIGMEVEKTSLHRDSIHEHILFTGIERDGSCGYEAVTHILPLIPESKWRNKVFALMWDAEKIIDDRYSQSDNSCGGHITVGVQGMNGDELREKLRPYAGILYALFRHRIKNRYCNANIRMAGRNDDYEMVINANGDNGWRDRDTRYQLALVKGNVLEFRLPSRFKSVKQMQNRYELMFEMIDYAVNSKRQSHEEFLRKVRPILMDMYHSKEQVNKLLQIAREMRVFIMDGKIHPNINKFVNPSGHWDSMVIKVETPKRKRNVTREKAIASIG
jgi:hypothetical protein